MVFLWEQQQRSSHGALLPVGMDEAVARLRASLWVKDVSSGTVFYFTWLQRGRLAVALGSCEQNRYFVRDGGSA